jgi:hypothetical protein
MIETMSGKDDEIHELKDKIIDLNQYIDEWIRNK